MKKCLSLLLAVILLWGLTACRKPENVPPTQVPRVSAVPTTQLATVPTVPPTELPVETIPEPSDDAFVKITAYIPTARQELMYATDQNFTGQPIYDFTDAYLRYGTVKKLQSVSEDLAELGLYLKIWDGFRPVSAQFKLWEICPDPTYVANPEKGFSSHSRGNTVDLTLVDGEGRELEMPTGFDDFSAKADRDYSDCPEIAASHAELLQIIMEKHGFTGYFGEWWHFSDTDSYPVEENFTPPASLD